MKLTPIVILLLLTFNANAADPKAVAKQLASYPNYGTQSTEKCLSVIEAAQNVGFAKDEGMSKSELGKAISHGMEAGGLPAEAEDLYKQLVEMRYSPDYSEASGDKFADDIEHMCTMPDVRLCDEEINAALLIAKHRDNGITSNAAMTRELLSVGGGSSLYSDLTDMLLYWPEHTIQ